jgi:hypothetical protein
MQQIAAREHPAREVAANTSRHGFQGSGRDARIRVNITLRTQSAACGRYGADVALRRPQHPERVAIVAVVLLVVVNLAIFGTQNMVRGTASQNLPGPIVAVDPQQGENILPQASISVSLLPRYTGQLTIDRQLIPDDQIINPSLSSFVFQPKVGHDITAFEPGPHNATFEAWPVGKSYEDAKDGRLITPYSWTFKVG